MSGVSSVVVQGSSFPWWCVESATELVKLFRSGFVTELDVKRFIVEMLSYGFVLAPCANPDCEQLFSSGTFCSYCSESEVPSVSV